MNTNINNNSYSATTTKGGFQYLTEFIEKINRLDSSLHLFRGQKNQEWNLLSTSHRKLNKNGGATNIHEEVIEDNVELISEYRLRGYGENNPNMTIESDLMILADLRHIGAANLLLDFTANALIALWFACEEAVDHDENGKEVTGNHHLNSKDGAVFILPVEDAGKYFPLSKFDQVQGFNLQESLSKDTTYYWKPALLNERIIAQNSYFVIGAEIPFDENTGKIIVPASQKQSIRSALDKLAGITELSLFHDKFGFAVAHSGNASHTKTENGHARIALKSFFNKDISLALAMEKALKHYTEVITQNPRNFIAYNNRGLAYAKTGRLPESIKDFDRAISVNNNYPEAYYNRGATQAKTGKYQEALTDFNKAIELDSNYAEAYHNRGAAKAKVGDFQEAIKDFDKAIELNSNDAEAYNNRGLAYFQIGELQESSNDYDKAIEIDGNYAEAYNNRGLAYFQIGEFQEAINNYNRVTEIDNNYADAYYNRGTAKVEMNNFQEALKDYVTAQSLFIEQDQLESANKTKQIIDDLSRKS